MNFQSMKNIHPSLCPSWSRRGVRTAHGSKQKTSFFLTMALLVTALVSGCGGGGGGSAPRAGAPANSNGVKGQMNLTVDFPPLPKARAASDRTAAKLAAEAVAVDVAVFALVDGREETTPTKTATLLRSSAAGGKVSTQIELKVGRYLARISSRGAGGENLGASLESVRIEPQKVTTVPTTLGLVHTDEGFTPASISLSTGERLVVHHSGLAPGLFSLEGVSDCAATLERTGALACTLRRAGSFKLKSPEGHTADVTVTEDAALLAQAKPSLGVRRAEGLALSGSTFTAEFLINNGGAALPSGLVLDPGNGDSPLAVTDTQVSVAYDEGGYLARLMDAAGNVLGQRFVGVFEAALDPPGTVVLAELPTSQSASSLLVQGTAPAGALVVVNVGEVVYTVVAGVTGEFSVAVTLAEGENPISAFAVNDEGLTGEAVLAVVAYAPEIVPGALASIEITGLTGPVVAGEAVTFVLTGHDAAGGVVAFSPTVELTGVEGSLSGNTGFTAITTGAGVLLVSGPGGVTAELAFDVIPGALASLSVTPGNVTTSTGEVTSFTATGQDALGNAIPDLTDLTWTTESLTGLSPDGVFAPTASGYGVVRVASGSVSAVACVSVNAAANTNVTRAAR